MADKAVTFALCDLLDRRSQVLSVRFGLVILFVFSTFLFSNDGALKFASINLSSIVAMLMIFIYSLDGMIRGTFILQKHPAQKPLFLLFAWALLSLLIAEVDPAKAIPVEACSYAWTTGLNSPDWRGISFLFRLFLSIFTIEFIIASIDTPRKYFTLSGVILFLYALVCFYGILQICLFCFFGIKLGYIVFTPGTNFIFRVGGYIGEPQTFAGLIASCYFLLLALLVRNPNPMKASHKLACYFVLLMATVNLMFTFSVAMIVAVFATLIILLFSALRKNRMIKILFFFFVGLFAFDLPRQMILGKLMNELTSVNERTITWINGLHMLTENLIAGVGIGQAPLVVSRVVTQDMMSKFHAILFFDQIRQPPMNSYIEWGAEMGIIGLFIIFYFIISLYFLSMRAKTSGQNFVNIAYGGGLVVIAIAANSSSGSFYIGYVSLSIAMFIAGMKIFMPLDSIDENEVLRGQEGCAGKLY